MSATKHEEVRTQPRFFEFGWEKLRKGKEQKQDTKNAVKFDRVFRVLGCKARAKARTRMARLNSAAFFVFRWDVGCNIM